jgi:hypothetical protein
MTQHDVDQAFDEWKAAALTNCSPEYVEKLWQRFVALDDIVNGEVPKRA